MDIFSSFGLPSFVCIWFRSIPPERLRKIVELLESDIIIRSVHDIKATDMGTGQGIILTTHLSNLSGHLWLHVQPFWLCGGQWQ